VTGHAQKGKRPRRFPPPWTVEELDACFIREGLRPAIHFLVTPVTFTTGSLGVTLLP
jgi:hypothetical protein